MSNPIHIFPDASTSTHPFHSTLPKRPPWGVPRLHGADTGREQSSWSRNPLSGTWDLIVTEFSTSLYADRFYRVSMGLAPPGSNQRHVLTVTHTNATVGEHNELLPRFHDDDVDVYFNRDPLALFTAPALPKEYESNDVVQTTCHSTSSGCSNPSFSAIERLKHQVPDILYNELKLIEDWAQRTSKPIQFGRFKLTQASITENDPYFEIFADPDMQSDYLRLKPVRGLTPTYTLTFDKEAPGNSTSLHSSPQEDAEIASVRPRGRPRGSKK